MSNSCSTSSGRTRDDGRPSRVAVLLLFVCLEWFHLLLLLLLLLREMSRVKGERPMQSRCSFMGMRATTSLPGPSWDILGCLQVARQNTERQTDSKWSPLSLVAARLSSNVESPAETDDDDDDDDSNNQHDDRPELRPPIGNKHTCCALTPVVPNYSAEMLEPGHDHHRPEYSFILLAIRQFPTI